MRPLIKAMLLLFVSLTVSHSALAKTMAEKLLDINDPEYNDALNQMQELDAKAKNKLAMELIKAYETSKDNEKRANAVLAVGDLSSEVKEGVPFLIKALDDTYHPTRQAAISGLQRSGAPTPQVVSAVTKKLTDTNSGVQAKALDAMITFGPAAKSAAGEIRKLMNSKDPAMKDLAKSALQAVEAK